MTEHDGDKVTEVTQSYGCKHSELIHILQDIQTEFGYLPEEALRLVSEKTGASLVDVYGMATFFKSFRLKPRGRHLVTVCMGTACHVRGAQRIVDTIERDIGIEPGGTTEDDKYSLETVNCIGACAGGPMVMVDGNYHGQMDTKQVETILEKYE
ncbi:NADH-quinone oxidoreductase subunit NuoE [Chloroflexota bacterium]